MYKEQVCSLKLEMTFPWCCCVVVIVLTFAKQTQLLQSPGKCKAAHSVPALHYFVHESKRAERVQISKHINSVFLLICLYIYPLDSSWNQNQKCWATTRKAAFLGVSRSLEVGSISHSQAPYPQIFQSKSYKAQRHMYTSPSGLQCAFQSGPQPSGPQWPPSPLIWGLSLKQNFILLQRCGMHEKHEEVFQILTSY